MIFDKLYNVEYSKKHKIYNICGIKLSKRFEYSREFNKLKKDSVKKNKIVFSNFCGKPFGCNPKYIALELLKSGQDYDLVWLANTDILDEDLDIPAGVRVVKNTYPEAIQELASAKFWISNVRLIKYFKQGLQKKDEQVYIQTWHGSLGIKKIDGDANSKFWERSTWEGFEEVDSKAVDYLISNSEFEDGVYKSAFWNRGEILQLGHPRNDVFFGDNETIKSKVYEKLGIAPSKKIILYVPSYRDNDRLYCYFMDYEKVVQACNEKFGGDWVMCVRLHPRAAQYSEKILMPSENVIDCSYYPDIQDLLVSAECAITDYSSCIFDYLLTYKPAFIYARDLEEFDEERGFYYPFSSTPFSVAKTNEDLINNIHAFDRDKYKRDVKTFLKDKGCIDDGKSAKRIADFIQKCMAGKHNTTSCNRVKLNSSTP